jgi:hypothetical protein
MKHIMVLLLVCAASTLLLIAPGCQTGPQSSWSDPVFVDNVALFLKATVANGVVIAITEDKNAAAYCKLAREALATVRNGADFTPGAFEDALSKVSINELKGKYAKLVIANLCLAYELYWSQMVADNIQGNAIAPKLIDAAIAGVDLGLAGQAPVVPNKPAFASKQAAKFHKAKQITK